MSALGELELYLKRVERRLRLALAWRGAAISAASALALTVVLVVAGNHYRFVDSAIPPMRALLFAGVGATVIFLLAIPLTMLTRRRATRIAEERVPGFQQRLLTVTERRNPEDPFTELVAEDALAIARAHEPVEFAAGAGLYGWLLAAVACVAALVWLIVAGPGFWGYGASLLWTGSAGAASRPLYDIAVQPGNRTVRRNSDQVISARLVGFSAAQVTLHAKYVGALKWDTVPMHANGDGYRFLFASLSENLEYFVDAGDSRSKHFTLAVKDLPRVKRIRVGLHYPSSVGLQDVVQQTSGDIRAVEGTQAEVSVFTDKPLERGLLMMDDGAKTPLEAQGDGSYRAKLTVVKDGAYHVAEVDNGETIRISEDYFIEAKKDEPPTVRITRPGRDPRVSPIEEMAVTIEAADDFGLNDLELHYSAGGGAEHVASLLPKKGTKEAKANTTVYLEDLKLKPGDLVTLYATARDGGTTSRSDILFAEAEPFDYKFRQSQESGGSQSGGDQDETKISERQKEIIAATWNELKGGKREQAQVKENAHFLSDLQGKLSEQAKALAERMGSRELAAANPQFKEFADLMQQASATMSSAVEQLRPAKWQDALPPEQSALQSLLRAEAMFRDIQVAFGQQAGGGRGASGANRDLARMFDLELDTSKNQYETGQSGAPSAAEQQKKLDEALQKLKELARRQQEMAAQPQSQQAFQQRWEQEQLRREAEQLRQEMQELGKQQDARASSSEGASSQSGQQNSQSGQAASQGSQSARTAGQRSAAATREAMRSLQRAEEEMREAVSGRDESAAQRARQELAEAQRKLEGAMEAQAGDSLSDLAKNARDLANRQQDLAEAVKRQYGADGVNTFQPGTRSGVQMPEMNGPGYSSWYRRRFGQEPDRPASPGEKALAREGERLSKDTQQLLRNAQEQAQRLSPEQGEAGRKLQHALSEAEQRELALRMEKTSEWLRRGYGSDTWPQQDSITEGMEQLSRQLQEAQQAVESGKEGAQGDGQAQRTARALSEVQSLRGQLASGSEPTIGGGSRGAMDDLEALGRGDRELRNYTDEALGYLRHMNGQDGLLDARLNSNAARSLQRLEIELARRLGQQGQAGARSETREDTPVQYRDAVAEYFKKLSQ